jgi:hypothetical protein
MTIAAVHHGWSLTMAIVMNSVPLRQMGAIPDPGLTAPPLMAIPPVILSAGAMLIIQSAHEPTIQPARAQEALARRPHHRPQSVPRPWQAAWRPPTPSSST